MLIGVKRNARVSNVFFMDVQMIEWWEDGYSREKNSAAA